MKITLDEGLQKHCDGLSEVYLDAPTVRSAIQGLYNKYPQLMAYMLGVEEVSKNALVILNDSELLGIEDLGLELSDTDIIHLDLLVPCGEWGAIVSAVSYVGTAMTTAAATATIGQIVTKIAVTAVISLAISTALSAIVGALSDTTEQSNQSIAQSAVYTFTGVQNTTASGTPIQMVYGEHRVGGQILNLFTTYTDAPLLVWASGSYSYTTETTTHLYGQYGLSEGEITSISDVKINGTPAKQFSSVTLFTDSLGKETQEPLKDFQATENTRSVSQNIRNIQNVPVAPKPLSVEYPVYGYVSAPAPTMYSLGGSVSADTPAMKPGAVQGLFVFSVI